MADLPARSATHPPAAGGTAVDDFLGTNPGPAWRRWLTWIAVVTATIALVVLGSRFVNGGQATHYASDVVQRGDVQVKLFGTGQLQSLGARAIGTRLTGKVLEMLAKTNDRVSEGQLLARIDPAPFTAAVTRAQQLIDARQAAFDTAQAAEQEARATMMRFDRVRRHSGGSVPSDREMDGANRSLGQASDATARAEVELAAARTTLAERQAQLAATQIRSPITGVVVTHPARVGQLLTGAVPAQTLFMIAPPFSRLRLDVVVGGADAKSLSRIRSAHVTVATLPGRSFPAAVKAIGDPSIMLMAARPAASPAAGTGRAAVALSLEVANPDLSLRPAMVATAQIDLDLHRDVLVVPNAALRFARASDAAERGGSKAIGPAVYVLGGDATPHRVAVVVDGSDGGRSIVRSADLSPGTRIITGLP